LIRKYYGENPRVKLLTKENGGIGSASNSAVNLTRGCYVGQLDADDVLKLDAVERCLELMNKDDSLSMVYGTTDYIDEHGEFLSEGWNWPVFSSEYLLTQMIVHHFRLFRRRDWSRTSGFNETITNAVDYDMMLKLAEVGGVQHINRVLYSYRKHQESTTVQGNGQQTFNNFKVIQDACDRLGINKKVVWSGNSNNPRHVMYQNR
jgi:chondroitin synthase